MEGKYKLRTMVSNLTMPFFLFLFLYSYVPPAAARKHRVVPLVSKNRNTAGKIQTYIVHVHQRASTASFSTDEDRKNWYMSFFPTSTTSTSLSESRLIHAYKSVATGFAARLTEEELHHMKQKPGFVHAYPDRIMPLLTTHSSDFLGLRRDVAGFWNDSNFGRGIIIGVLDTGIFPGHPSFRDNGMSPPPAKWKGSCEFNKTDCNNKLIGARTFVQGLSTGQGPYDYNGHGTHTASTAAGMFVENAKVDGMANGTASGMAPYAHLAIYKVCDKDGCADSDILAGLDAAIEDGVDVVSISIGGPSLPFYNDSTAIGTFATMEKGIFVSCAGGNDGPASRSLSNEVPWILTVGASTIDRSIRSTVQLGSRDKFNGETIYQNLKTTASLASNDGSPIPNQNLKPADFFASGSGHINASRANKPGLIYYTTSDDYIGYLCGLQYTANQVSAIARRPIKCTDIAITELNYPSFMVFLSSTNNYTAVVKRIVTNVGPPSSTYSVQVDTPAQVSVTVNPEKLVFSKTNEKAQFSVTFTATASTRGTVSSSRGYLTWFSSDNTVTVNSPVMVAVS